MDGKGTPEIEILPGDNRIGIDIGETDWTEESTREDTEWDGISIDNTEWREEKEIVVKYWDDPLILWNDPNNYWDGYVGKLERLETSVWNKTIVDETEWRDKVLITKYWDDPLILWDDPDNHWDGYT
jgi:hypothetical protein